MASAPTDLSSDRVIRALQKTGFVVIREGKHIVMRKAQLLVIIPRHKRIKRETLRDIIKDAELTVEFFIQLL